MRKLVVLLSLLLGLVACGSGNGESPEEVWFISPSAPLEDCTYAIFGYPGPGAKYECTVLQGTAYSLGTRDAYGALEIAWHQEEDAKIKLGGIGDSALGECKEEILQDGKLTIGLVKVGGYWIQLRHPCRGPS